MLKSRLTALIVKPARQRKYEFAEPLLIRANPLSHRTKPNLLPRRKKRSITCCADKSHHLAIALGHRQRSGNAGDAGGRAPDRLVQSVRAVGRPRCRRGILSRASWRRTAIGVLPPSLRQAWARSHRRGQR